MQPIPFAQFEQIAEKYAEENSSIKLKSGGGSVRDSLEKRKTTDSVFAKREIKAEQNLHVMDEFRKALESRFGAAGRMAFEQQLSDKVDAAQSLRPADINMTIAVAKGAAVGFVADGVMSQAELDTRAAMQHVTLPPGPRGEMLRKEVFDALAQIAPQFAAIDRSGDGRLLAKLGTNLAETLDQKYVLTAVAKEFTARLDEPYSALIDELTTRERTPGHALQQILNDHPPLERAFRTEVDQFVVNSQKLADRLATDMAHINADFDSLRPLGAGPATGIKDIHITSSDPHHGGNRVCILTLDNDQKIVYKPRDVRIDAALVGHQGPAPDDLNTLNDNNRSLVEIGNSLLVNNGDINAPARMPTLQFLPKQDAAGVGTNEGRYGYVQCLSNGTEQDNVVDQETAAVLHQQLGQLSALMLVAGVRDLHHTNMMISGGQPYLTDVEIAFDQDLLHTFGKNVNDAANNLAGASIGGSIMSSQLNLMWENGGESVRLDTEYVVEDDHLISNPKGTTFAAEGVTENMLIVDGQGANRNLSEGMPVSVHTHYSDQVADGFSKMLSSLAKDATAVGRIKAFIDSTTGMHVRHHPIATGNQLAILQAGRTDKFYSSPQLTDLDTSIQTAVGANIQLKRGQIDNREREELKVPIECTQNAMVSDLKKGDVPYFTRELGSDALHHNSTTALNVNPSDDPIYAQKFFSEDPLAMAKLNLDNIAANLNVTVATLANSYKNYVDNLNVPYMNPSVKEDFAKKIGPEMAAQIGAPVNLILLAQRQRAAQNGPALPGAGGMGI